MMWHGSGLSSVDSKKKKKKKKKKKDKSLNGGWLNFERTFPNNIQIILAMSKIMSIASRSDWYRKAKGNDFART